jgi:drug/metabolite transporter (DMT)-like permease
MMVAVRFASAELHTFQIVGMRNVFGLLIMAPWVLRCGLAMLRTKKLGLYALRGGLDCVSMFCWFSAIALLPLGEMVSLTFAGPLFATVGAALILGERVRSARWIAVTLGFLGVLIIVRPGTEAMSPYVALPLLSAAFGAGATLTVKRLSRTEPADRIVCLMVLFMAPISLPPALFVWETPSLTALGFVLLTALMGNIGHLCTARAFRLADASALLPVSYIKLPIMAFIGYWLFREIPDGYTWLGAAVIIGSTLYVVHSEASAAKRDEEARAGLQPAIDAGLEPAAAAQRS